MKIIALGKIKERWITDGINEYAKRLKNLEIIEVKDSKGEEGLIDATKEDAFIAMSEEGKQLTSVELANFIKDKRMTFMIGGPEGLTEKTKSKAKMILSLSKMTFTHEMARLFLVEQIYRAQSIIDNRSYHR